MMDSMMFFGLFLINHHFRVRFISWFIAISLGDNCRQAGAEEKAVELVVQPPGGVSNVDQHDWYPCCVLVMRPLSLLITVFGC